MIQDDAGPEAVTQVESMLEALARRWESVPPSELVERLDTFGRLVETKMNHRAADPHRREWRRTQSRLLVMSAVAQNDNGQAGQAVVSARAALVLARNTGDGTTAAHAGLVLAELAAYMFESETDGLSLASAARAAAPHSHVAVLAATIEAHIRAGRGEPTERVMSVLRSAENLAARLPPGAPGYALNGIHPGYLPTFSGSVLVGTGALDEGRGRLAEAAELFDQARAPGALAAVRLYQASAAMHARELDEAQTLATRALATAAVRPTAWLTNGIMLLADRARHLGVDWSGMVTQAREWAPA